MKSVFTHWAYLEAARDDSSMNLNYVNGRYVICRLNCVSYIKIGVSAVLMRAFVVYISGMIFRIHLFNSSLMIIRN